MNTQHNSNNWTSVGLPSLPHLIYNGSRHHRWWKGGQHYWTPIQIGTLWLTFSMASLRASGLTMITARRPGEQRKTYCQLRRIQRWSLDTSKMKVSLGRVIGPLEPELAARVHVSPFGVIPKGHTGKWCPIVDLSSPPGSSVNDGIDPTLCSLIYISVDTVAEKVAQLGRGKFLGKVDVKSAYRIQRIACCWQYSGVEEPSWIHGCLLDCDLPWGLATPHPSPQGPLGVAAPSPLAGLPMG